MQAAEKNITTFLVAKQIDKSKKKKFKKVNLVLQVYTKFYSLKLTQKISLQSILPATGADHKPQSQEVRVSKLGNYVLTPVPDIGDNFE